ncbi:MAG: transglutaminase family protein [Cyanobacteria bacterium P01_E01_bin.34]
MLARQAIAYSSPAPVLTRVMLYQICHQTTYSYSQPVLLKPHTLNLRPQSNSWQHVRSCSIQVSPSPESRSDYADLDGNSPTKLWFDRPTQTLSVQATSIVETLQSNPFLFLLEPWAIALPFDYPQSLQSRLSSYLQPLTPSIHPAVVELAHTLLHKVDAKPLDFLNTLNQHINQSCRYIHRATGRPWSAGMTWAQKQGSCRDLCVLFMEVCRQVGLATRFASGYQEGDPGAANDLHAWVEVYLPGAGWRGYDPTLGLAVSDRHITISASAHPHDAAPIVGTFTPVNPVESRTSPPTSTLETQILLQQLSQ